MIDALLETVVTPPLVLLILVAILGVARVVYLATRPPSSALARAKDEEYARRVAEHYREQHRKYVAANERHRRLTAAIEKRETLRDRRRWAHNAASRRILTRRIYQLFPIT